MDRPRRILNLIWVWAVLATSGQGGTDENSASGPPPDEFAETLAQLCEWRNSLTSVHLEYRWWQLSPDSAVPVTDFRQQQWTWVDQWVMSESVLMRSLCEHHVQGDVCARLWVGRNAEMQIQALQRPGRSLNWDVDTQRVLDGRMLDFPRCHPLESLYVPSMGWSVDYFRNSPPVYVGEKMVNGHRCIGYRPSESSFQIIWLDPEHGGLPRQVEMIDCEDGWEWECTSYLKTASGHWFPATGRFGWKSVGWQQFEVKHVATNQPMEIAHFRPPVGPSKIRQMNVNAGVSLAGSQVLEQNWIWQIVLACVTAILSLAWWQWKHPEQFAHTSRRPEFGHDLAVWH